MADEIYDVIVDAWRQNPVDGLPGTHQPNKADIHVVGRVVQTQFDAVAALAAAALAGITWLAQTIRVRSTANVDIATALENGDTLNGVVLATGDHVFLGSQTAPAENGLYTVPASGAAARATFANSAAELARIGFLVAEGTVGEGERWMLPLAAADITLETTALAFARVGIENDVSAEVVTARGPFAALGDRLDDFDAQIDAAERIAAANARGALYGITDPTEAALFGAQGVEIDFIADYYRVGYTAPVAVTDLPGWTFSRALAGTALNASGTLDSFATGDPRITDLGLLVEPARVNSILRSQEFDNAAWALSSAGTGVAPSVSANAATAPDGTATADRVTLSLGGGTTGADRSALWTNAGFDTVTGEAYWGSVWVKGTAGQKICYRHVAGDSYEVHTFSGSWERIGRSEIAWTTVGSFQIGLVGGLAEPVTNAVTFDIWGAQVEEGAYATSYIPTTSVTVTRPADAPALTGLNIPNRCTVIVDFAYIGSGNEIDTDARLVMALAGDTTDDRALVVNSADGLKLVVQAATVTTIQCDAYGAAAADAVQRLAMRIAPDNSRIARNGGIGGLDADGGPPTVFTRLGLGMYPWDANQGGVFVRKVVVIPASSDDRSLVSTTGGTPLPDVAAKWETVVSAAAFSARDSARTFRLGGRLFLANGFAVGGIAIKDVWSSLDGLTFTLVNAAPPYEDWSAVVSLGAAIYAFNTEMWRSLDGGVTWTKIISVMPFTVDTDSPVLVVNDKLLAIPGTGLSPDADNGVWQYDVGLNTWTQIYVAAWGPRTVPVACEFDGAIYLYGGFDRSAPNVPPEATYTTYRTLNDLWKSIDDGVTWTQVVADMPCQPRAWPSMVVFEAELYLIGGFDNLADPITNFTDSFKTSDGVTWALVELSEVFTERHAANAYVVGGRLFLAAGKGNLEPGSGVRNDIWELNPG